jgi:hypothetical protein
MIECACFEHRQMNASFVRDADLQGRKCCRVHEWPLLVCRAAVRSILVNVGKGPFMLAGARSFGRIAAMRLTAARSPLYQMLSRSMSHEQKIRPVANGPELTCSVCQKLAVRLSDVRLYAQ